MVYIEHVYAGLCGFIPCLSPPLYAGTLYQGLYQVYATRAPLGFIPGRSSSWEEAPAAGACPFSVSVSGAVVATAGAHRWAR